MSKTLYICESWQGLLQHITSIVGKGYYWYLPIIPKKKNVIKKMSEQRWERIDHRLLAKFEIIGKTKHKRYYGKKKGKANYLYFRYNNFAFVFKTKGEIVEETDSEKFYDIRERAVEIQISTDIAFKIYKASEEEHFTVYFTRDTFRGIKAGFFELIDHRNLYELKFRFDNLNKIPTYSGIFKQKVSLKQHIFKHAKKSGLILNDEDFPISNYRNTYNVFKDTLVF